MIIYHYHPDTDEYLGEGLADESPLEPGVWLIPAHATTTPLPPYNPNTHICLYQAGDWVVAEKTPEPQETPPPLPTPAEAKAAKLAALAAHRYRVETGGIMVDDITIQTDRESQAMLTGAMLVLQSDPDRRIDWKGVSGWTTLGLAEITAISSAVAHHVQACFSAERRHAEAIAALPDDLDAIDAYDFTTGWPT
jgi:hypothetical protein